MRARTPANPTFHFDPYQESQRPAVLLGLAHQMLTKKVKNICYSEQVFLAPGKNGNPPVKIFFTTRNLGIPNEPSATLEDFVNVSDS